MQGALRGSHFFGDPYTLGSDHRSALLFAVSLFPALEREYEDRVKRSTLSFHLDKPGNPLALCSAKVA